MRNKIGPNTEPCGTPLSTSAQSDVIPLTQTVWRLFFNHSVIQPRSLPSIPCAFNFRISNPSSEFRSSLVIYLPRGASFFSPATKAFPMVDRRICWSGSSLPDTNLTKCFFSRSELRCLGFVFVFGGTLIASWQRCSPSVSENAQQLQFQN